MGLAQIRLFVTFSMVLCLLLAFTFVSGEEGYSDDRLLGVQSLRDSSDANTLISPNENLQGIFTDLIDVVKHFCHKIINFLMIDNQKDKKPPTLRSVHLDQFLESLRQKRSYQKFVNKFIQPEVQRQ